MVAGHTVEYRRRPIVRRQASSIAPRTPATAPVCALVLLLALPTSAQIAQPTRRLAELSLEDLMNIEVTSASKRPQPLNDVPAALFVVTHEDIRRSGATSIPDVLRMVPGLQVARIDANKWAVSARGFGGRFADKLLVLMDGRTLYTPLFSGVFWDVQDTVLEDIDRIEVIRGPGATLWGANAVNGVINIITKASEDTQGILATAGGGTEDRGFGTLRYGGELASGQGHYRVYAKHSDRDSSQDLLSGAQSADAGNMSRTGFRVDWQGAGADSLTIQGDGYSGDSGETVRTASLEPPHSRRFSAKQGVSGGNVQAQWRRAFSEEHALSAQVYYDRTNRETMLFGVTRNTIDIEIQEHRPVAHRHTLIWGAGFRHSGDDVRNTFSISLNPQQRNDELYTGFLQDDIALVDKALQLTVGAKLEHNSYSGFEFQPNIRLAWTPTVEHSVWGSVARAVRTPARADHDLRLNGLLNLLPAGDPLNPFPLPLVTSVLGNGQVASEKLTAYEVGYRLKPVDALGIDVAAFYNQYNELRTVTPGPPLCGPAEIRVATNPLCVLSASHIVAPLHIGNGVNGGRYGVEVSGDWRPQAWWRISPAYSHLQMREHVAGPLFQFTDGANPTHQVSVRSAVDLPGAVEFDTWLRYVDRLPTMDIDSYLTLDARLAWTLGGRLEIALIGQNLLDAQHLEFVSELGDILPIQIERSGYVRVRWTY